MGAGHADIHRLAWAPQLLQVAADVADAMAYLHQPPAIVHRDLKSSNVLLDADGRAVVCGACPSGAMCLFQSFVTNVMLSQEDAIVPKYRWRCRASWQEKHSLLWFVCCILRTAGMQCVSSKQACMAVMQPYA